MILSKSFTVRASKGSDAYECSVDLDFSGVDVEAIAEIACKPLIIDLQKELREELADGSEIATHYEIDVATAMPNGRRANPVEVMRKRTAAMTKEEKLAYLEENGIL